MKIEFDKKYFKICLYAFITIAALLLFNRMLQSSDNIWKSIVNTISFLLELLSPFIIAIFIAYLLSPAVSGIDTLLGKIFKHVKHVRARKLVSLIIVYAATVTILVLTLSYVIPGIFKNIGDLLRHLPEYYGQLQVFYKDNILTHPLFTNETVQRAIQTQLVNFNGNLSGYMTATVTGITTFVLRFLSSVAGAVLGLVLSFYLLNEREHIVESFSRLLHARLGERRSTSVMNFLRDVDKVFGRYISAKLLLALVMFALSFIALSIFQVRYSVLMSAIVAVTTLVPYLGPFIGAVPPVVIALLDSPQKGITVAIALLIIHQIDNYVFEPYIFSDKMGLSPFWILLSIIVVGGLFGLWGVLLAVPVAGVIKLIINRYIQMRHLRRQKMEAEGPEPGQ